MNSSGATRGFTLMELMIVIAIIAVIAAIAIPGLLSSQRASNERNAATSLKTITSAQADFRANDRDGNKVPDFWTFNLSGLYTLTNGAVTGAPTGDPPIRLIELSLALADANSTATGTTEDTPVTSYGFYSPKASHWYNALASDDAAIAPDNDYTVDTGGSPAMGPVHHPNKFGFICWPDSLSAGKFAYIINEDNAIFRRALTSNIKPTTSTPPGVAAAPLNAWPSDASLKSFWSKLD